MVYGAPAPAAGARDLRSVEDVRKVSSSVSEPVIRLSRSRRMRDVRTRTIRRRPSCSGWRHDETDDRDQTRRLDRPLGTATGSSSDMDPSVSHRPRPRPRGRGSGDKRCPRSRCRARAAHPVRPVARAGRRGAFGGRRRREE